MSKWSIILLLVLGCGVISISDSQAESVHLTVSRGEKQQGQGWLFRTASGFCGVVTAAHVVTIDGVIGRVLIHSKDKGEGIGSNVRVLSPPDAGLDIALMRVDGAIADAGCTSATLGGDGDDVRAELAKRRPGLVNLVEPSGGDSVVQELEFLGSAQEEASRLSLRASRASDKINKGYSGSVVVSPPDGSASSGLRPKPLAMITDVQADGSSAQAVRFDRVKAEITRALARDGGHTPSILAFSDVSAHVASWRGETTDPNCSAANAVATQQPCGWKVRAAAGERSVAIVLELSAPTFQGLELAVTGLSVAGARATFEGATRSGEDSWVWLKSAPVSGGLVVISIAPTEVQRVRVTLPLAAKDVAEIRVKSVR